MGVGPIGASTLAASVGDFRQFATAKWHVHLIRQQQPLAGAFPLTASQQTSGPMVPGAA